MIGRIKKLYLGLVVVAALSGLVSGLIVRAEPVGREEASLPLSGAFRSNHRISDAAKRSYWAHTFSSGAHSLAVHGRDVYAVWYDFRNMNSDVFFSKSTDGGITFGSNQKVNDDHGNSRQYKPTLGVDKAGNIYMIWRDDRRGHADIFFAKSDNGGKSFSKNRRLNDDTGWAYQGNPSLGVSPDGSVVAAWSDDRKDKDDIYLTVSGDGGRSFSKNLKINDDQGDFVQSHPSVGAGPGGLVFVAWEDFRQGTAKVYMSRSTDGGKTFEPNRQVVNGSGGDQISPSVAVNPQGQVAVAWTEFVAGTPALQPPNAAKGEPLWWRTVRKGDADIFVAVSLDGGIHFGTPVKVNDDPPGNPQAFPSVAINSQGELFLSWEDFRNGQSDIYFSEIQGKVGLAPNLIVNDDTSGAPQYHPSVAVDEAGKALVLWTDGRGNPFQVHKEGDEQGNDVYFSGYR
jgi:hypothetical protein